MGHKVRRARHPPPQRIDLCLQPLRQRACTLGAAAVAVLLGRKFVGASRKAFALQGCCRGEQSPPAACLPCGTNQME